MSPPASSGRNTRSWGGKGERKEPAKDGQQGRWRCHRRHAARVGFVMGLAQVLVPLSNRVWKPLCAPKGLKSSWGCPDGSFSSWGCTDAPQSPWCSPREQVSSLLCLIFPLHFPRQGPQLTSFISSEGFLRDIALGCISAVPERRKVPISFFFFLILIFISVLPFKTLASERVQTTASILGQHQGLVALQGLACCPWP